MTGQSLPIHPQLVHFPIALFLLGSLSILVYLWKNNARFYDWGFKSLVAGWLLMIPTVTAGLIEASRLEDGTTADQLADKHTLAGFLVWTIFSMVIFLLIKWRKRMDVKKARVCLVILILLGVTAIIITSNFGGRLVYHMGVGVQEIVR